jgi:hypothetical protein
MPSESNNHEEDVEAGLGTKDEASHDQVHQTRTRPPLPPHTALLQSDAVHTDGDVHTTAVTVV